MVGAGLDWSMGAKAPLLADWELALRVGRRVGGPGPRVPPAERVRINEELNELVHLAEDLVAGFTGLQPGRTPARAWVMGRGDWVRRNLLGLQRMLEPLAARIVRRRPERSALARAALGGQVGALLGYLARRVLGQFDAFAPPDDEGLLYFVGPNLIEVEQRFGVSPRDFRLWVAIHEVTHRVQFAAAPWLRTRLEELIDGYLAAVPLDAGALGEHLRRIVEEVLVERRDRSPLALLLTPEQRAVVERAQALMSVLEGHASYVMNEVAAGRVDDLPRLRRALAARRRTGGPERALQRAIGLDRKIRQYDVGERFVREVARRAGMGGVNLVWREQANLPSGDEVADPARWLARVGG
ncbi:MAG: hypothetical protein KatS3mg013_1712 [Actinomycetota bacterium]|jgi:coenzyme F420 biosynthesis associated uncharacterized protein|nr:MAG: hypothetical protein KatS3mg013_1712 [Actinomycetota bacterium]